MEASTSLPQAGGVRAPATTRRDVAIPVSPQGSLSSQDEALVRIGEALRRAGYSFTTVTPLSHRRVLERPAGPFNSLRDIFGWSRPFSARDLPDSLLSILESAGALAIAGDKLRSNVRFSTLGDQLFVHSAFPTEGADAVFFGPDTYRFARAIRQEVSNLLARSGMRLLDLGAGSGAGGLHAASLLQRAEPHLTLTDINRSALRFSHINAVLNEVPGVQVVESDLYGNVAGPFDLIVSNPPYLVDPLARLYRHGGGRLGSELSVRIVEEGLAHLAPKGRLLLYTGSAIVDGVDLFENALRERLKDRRDLRLTYDEIDPDVFGEELEAPPYDCVDRIAVVSVGVEGL
jgi:methylase of polypeptide subunit release factors